MGMNSAVLELPFTPEIERVTAPLYDKVSNVISKLEWPGYAPYIHEINRLKKEKNAVILAHNYQSAQIFHTVADVVGDSLALARDAARTDADIIVVCGVHFMAETAKLLNMDKKLLIPDAKAGCSLADSITASDVRLLREKYPGRPVVTYVNTSAEVKAECDICCTSGNAVKIVESLGAEEIIFLPDQYLANYVATQTKTKIIAWHGACEVHERFTAEDIRFFRKNNPGAVVLAHPECPPSVLAEADYVGSTAGMENYVKSQRPARVILITECAMSDNLQAANPNTQFVRPCNLCPHMQRITLPKILAALQNEAPEVLINAEVAERARHAVERMLAVG